jgi:HEPN domain-containing protein
MGMDITRGMAVLKAAWSFGSTDTPAETTTVAEVEGTDLSGEFLAEAQSYLNMGRHQSAAIMAGDALEEALRRLCSDNRVALSRPTVDGMIAELARQGVYDSLVEQQLSEYTSLYEKAMSGLWSEVSKDDVESMLRDLRAFVVDHVSNN